MTSKSVYGWASVVMLIASAASAQDADLTILVDGPLLELGGVVEITAYASPQASGTAQTVTVTGRYVRVELL